MKYVHDLLQGALISRRPVKTFFGAPAYSDLHMHSILVSFYQIYILFTLPAFSAHQKTVKPLHPAAQFKESDNPAAKAA